MTIIGVVQNYIPKTLIPILEQIKRNGVVLWRRRERLEIAEEYLKRAKNKLKGADLLFSNELLDDTISRAYYAVYLSIYAVLYPVGETPRAHDGLIYAFGLKLIKTGIIDKRYAKILSRLRRIREESDYAAFVYIDKAEAKELIEEAKEFVSKMEEIIKKLGELYLH